MALKVFLVHPKSLHLMKAWTPVSLSIPPMNFLYSSHPLLRWNPARSHSPLSIKIQTKMPMQGGSSSPAQQFKNTGGDSDLYSVHVPYKSDSSISPADSLETGPLCLHNSYNHEISQNTQDLIQSTSNLNHQLVNSTDQDTIIQEMVDPSIISRSQNPFLLFQKFPISTYSPKSTIQLTSSAIHLKVHAIRIPIIRKKKLIPLLHPNQLLAQVLLV